MKIYKLMRRDEDVDHDEAAGFVVLAGSPAQARRLAAEQAGDEGRDVWLSKEAVECIRIDSTFGPGVLLRDFHAG